MQCNVSHFAAKNKGKGAYRKLKRPGVKPGHRLASFGCLHETLFPRRVGFLGGRMQRHLRLRRVLGQIRHPIHATQAQKYILTCGHHCQQHRVSIIPLNYALQWQAFISRCH